MLPFRRQVHQANHLEGELSTYMSFGGVASYLFAASQGISWEKTPFAPQHFWSIPINWWCSFPCSMFTQKIWDLMKVLQGKLEFFGFEMELNLEMPPNTSPRPSPYSARIGG